MLAQSAGVQPTWVRRSRRQGDLVQRKAGAVQSWRLMQIRCRAGAGYGRMTERVEYEYGRMTRTVEYEYGRMTETVEHEYGRMTETVEHEYGRMTETIEHEYGRMTGIVEHEYGRMTERNKVSVWSNDRNSRV
ncbi:hypothetical protein SLEP1_g19205 [Rubroshorea leprosula]|nr:hypothetical protein SLEP1_g19205 [Rubroshorea leprosula]